MKKILTFICALVLSINISAQTPLTEALDFQATAHHGEEINLFEILDNGQYVVIDFFFSTCKPCKTALPQVIEAYYELGENQDSVYFMEISPTDHNNSINDEWLANYSVPYPTIHTQTGGDTGREIYDLYKVKACPTFVFIAPDRKILLQDYHPIPSSELLVNDLRRLMKGYNADTLYAPTKLTAEAINETSALLSWEEVENAYRYNIYWGDSLVAKDVAETSYLMTNLEVGKEYCYNVTATYLERESAHSEVACVTTEEGMTFASPANVVATPTNDSTIVLTWNPVEKADSYKVYRGTELLATVTDTTYTEEGLEAETQYCYVVTSSLKTIESVASEEVCATTLEYVEPEQPADTTTLAAPTNLRATIRQDVPGFKYKYEITMAWDAVEGAKGYEVYVNTADTTGFQMGYTNGTAYVAGTNKESTFEFYVIAFDDSIVSVASEPCTVTIVDDAIEEMNASFNIYPNPVNDKLVIETEEIVKEVVVFDIYGRRQELSAVSYQPSAVDVSGLNSGVYFVKVVTANGEAVQRFVKK